MKKGSKGKAPSESDIDWDWILGSEAANRCGLKSGDVEALSQAIGRHGKRCVRLRPEAAIDSLPFETEAVPWYGAGRFLIDSSIRPGAFLQYAVGEYYIQDAASLLPMALADIQPGEAVCDLCASPGGKSTAALEQLNGYGYLLANEVIHGRVDVLQMALARSGYDNYAIASQSPESLAESLTELFDCVIVDAPCTGQSMVARGKQSLASFSRRQVDHSAQRQLSILKSAVRLVRPGGRLIYSTCTFAHAENEAVVEAMLQLLPGWSLIERSDLGAWRSGATPGCYRLWPHQDHCSGGFAAGLVRSESAVFEALDRSEYDARSDRDVDTRGSRRSENGSRSLRQSAPARIEWDGAPFDEWSAGEAKLFARGDQLHAFHGSIPQVVQERALGGMHLADRLSDLWVPQHAMACASRIGGQVIHRRTVELSRAEAVRFMAGESLSVACSNDASTSGGRAVACYGGKPLGWSKQTSGRLQNHLPKSLRGHYIA